MPPCHPVVARVTERIEARSRPGREDYLRRLQAAADEGPVRRGLSCTNLAHAFAAAPEADKEALKALQRPNVAIVSAYNDMLSAHQPLERFPALLKQAVREAGGTAQFAGGVPAMCDGVTQGQPGMELSLFSRDVIAMATAVALSHNVFDAGLCLGVCDKIVPGLLIGALHFGHLPFIFVPGGPMTSGLPNEEKARIRAEFAEGRVGRDALLESEAKSYHGPGTCTFYGTANSNQMMMEVMGLHLPGAAFVNPNTPLRDALTIAAGHRVMALTARGETYTPVGRVVDERALVNAIVGLLATGGSTNHTIHLVAIARAAGIQVTWDDFHELSSVVPLLTRIYPSGKADVNHFHAAGGMGFLVRELLDAGLLHEDVLTVAGEGLRRYAEEPWLHDGGVAWRAAPAASADPEVLRPVSEPFSADGGLRVLDGNLGRAVIKVSAVKPEHRVVEAPARVFEDQQQVLDAFRAGELDGDMVAVVRFQGPRANGMPELHKLTPELGVLLGRGHKVALVTDGRMSGASGKVPAAIHVTPECLAGGPLGRVRDGDIIRVDAERGRLEALVPEAEWQAREGVAASAVSQHGMGRELFGLFRAAATGAEDGARSFGLDADSLRTALDHERVG
ncbi:phosphogluconate dehydratase [Sediminicurvatus halobius]|uniref:Phosphogluconate dehydratase n=1 Tax=Sediminicurvatus halobius TaxID=2182432 RepID=A0A2U2N622_9GAMM|nr:phosphogluconate dehydratase [Spiribacter halobius]PWG64661.1 phosphogluconate dehydratase [Spiribacter halobius]UEX79015.1 phosphogluconate dehydratase [Spiribacter halobius]